MAKLRTKQGSFFSQEGRRYLDSLQRLWQQKSVLLIDLLSFSGVLFLFFAFEQLFSLLSQRLLPSETEAQLQELLLFGSETQLEQILQGLRVYVLLFVFLLAAVLIVSAIIIACSRSYLWHKIHGKQWKRKFEWRWIAMLLLLTLVFAVFFLPVLFVNTIIQLFVQTLTPNVTIHEIISLLLVLLWLVLYVFYVLAVKYSFHHSQKAWFSLGEGFKSLWQHKEQVLVALGLSTLTIAVFNFLILYGLSRIFLVNQLPALVTQFILLVIFVGWLRFYLLSIFKGSA